MCAFAPIQAKNDIQKFWMSFSDVHMWSQMAAILYDPADVLKPHVTSTPRSTPFECGQLTLAVLAFAERDQAALLGEP